ncbi:hypothetical protein MTR_1g014445 [Medicago truncatula]|uniref:Uncharacterized protein n=1 Tax=Medicago truncatula TaxID=3880 RepID=A0A072VEP4_MEDTR|nr:hypothetical protein MTR_1g014445 [Medicago truncatula]
MDVSDDAPLPSQAVGTISAASETASAISKAVIELKQLSIMAEDTETAASKTVNELPIKAIVTVSATNEINNQVPIKAIIETVSADNGYEIPQTKRRRPCHGWISDDDEEEGELIELPALYKLVNGVPMKMVCP